MRRSSLFILLLCGSVFSAPSEEQLARWLKQYPDADINKDGRLTVEEAKTQVDHLISSLEGEIRGLQSNEDTTADIQQKNTYKTVREYLEKYLPNVKEIKKSLD